MMHILTLDVAESSAFASNIMTGLIVGILKASRSGLAL